MLSRVTDFHTAVVVFLMLTWRLEPLIETFADEGLTGPDNVQEKINDPSLALIRIGKTHPLLSGVTDTMMSLVLYEGATDIWNCTLELD